jgi:transcription antitermination factor NusG
MHTPIGCVSSDSVQCPPWFAVSTIPRHEKRVSELMGQHDIETFFPVYRAERQWKKRAPVILDLPLFPTYIFARIGHPQKSRVLNTPGVISIVGNGKEPLPIPGGEIETLRAGLRERPAEPHLHLAIGDRVRIKSGPLAGLDGILVFKRNRFRMVLAINLIMQSISVEIDLEELAPLDSPVDVTQTKEVQRTAVHPTF